MEEKLIENRRIDLSTNNVTKDSITSDASYKFVEFVNGLNNKVTTYLEQLSKMTCLPYKSYSFSYSGKGPDMRYLQKRLSFNLSQALNPEAISAVIINSISYTFNEVMAAVESNSVTRKSGGAK